MEERSGKKSSARGKGLKTIYNDIAIEQMILDEASKQASKRGGRMCIKERDEEGIRGMSVRPSVWLR